MWIRFLTVVIATVAIVGCALEPEVPAAIAIVSGADQTGTVNRELPEPVVVHINDASGNPFVGAGVTFTPDVGSGSANPTNVETDATGRASTRWTLGNRVGDQLLRASATQGSASATITATGLPNEYDIEIRFLDPQPSSSQRQVFTDAEVRWETLVIGDLPDWPADLSASTMDQCVAGAGAVMETVDDLIIYVRIDSIDGPGGAVGQARPCFLRSTDLLPFIGQMVFDEADVAALESAGLLDVVVLHEMAHVLGFGTLWSDNFFGLLANPSCPDMAGVDTHFTGQHATEAFDQVGGGSYTAGEKVPVENSASAGCPGTRDGHWRESEFDEELMTGTLNNGANPLSIVSVGSLRDLGYTVDYSSADPYSYTAPLLLRVAPGTGSGFELLDDVGTGPLFVVDPEGRIVQTIRPPEGR